MSHDRLLEFQKALLCFGVYSIKRLVWPLSWDRTRLKALINAALTLSIQILLPKSGLKLLDHLSVLLCRAEAVKRLFTFIGFW